MSYVHFYPAETAMHMEDIHPSPRTEGSLAASAPETPCRSYPEIPLFFWLDEAADKTPTALACRYHDIAISYERLRREAEIAAANLRARGVKPGDRVGIMLPNLPQTMIAFWAVLKAGAVVVMINPLYMEKELLHQIHDADIAYMISYDLCWPKFAKLRDQLGIGTYYILGESEYEDAFRREGSSTSVPYDSKTILPFADLLTGEERLSETIASPRETLALLQYTGGTTGLSKGAMLSHYNVASNILQMGEHIKHLHEEPQVFMAVLPFFHVYGLNTCLVLPTLFHATVVPMIRFAPLELLAALKHYNGTVLPGAPAMYISMLQQKNKELYSLKSLRICISGSAPMPVEAMKRFEQTFETRIMEGYGLSEASPITHMTPARGLRKAGSIGPTLPGTEARIVDLETGSKHLPAGEAGELIIRGAQVMSGYWKKTEATADTLRDGWLYTGDVAFIDEDGFCYIVDRKKDMVIVGGYNVSPREIDEVLYEHPKVLEAVSVGVPHRSRGEVIKACIVLKPGESCDRSDIIRWCRERLANYKVPRLVEFRDELPKTSVGKILRRTLRAEEEEKQRQRQTALVSPGEA